METLFFYLRKGRHQNKFSNYIWNLSGGQTIRNFFREKNRRLKITTSRFTTTTNRIRGGLWRLSYPNPELPNRIKFQKNFLSGIYKKYASQKNWMGGVNAIWMAAQSCLKTYSSWWLLYGLYGSLQVLKVSIDPYGSDGTLQCLKDWWVLMLT